MNLEVAKWIEIWLDSASERAYQPAFVSALFASGYSILHNTAHTSLELGKDVIAWDKDRRLHAFQLKGDPGAKLTMSKWQSIYEQIVQLVSVPVPRHLTNNRHVPHVPVLVTNGEVDEAVGAAIELFNTQTVPRLPGAKPLIVWRRGDLLELFGVAAGVVWPGNLPTQVLFLQSISKSGLNTIRLSEIQELAVNSLQWDNKCSKRAALERAAGAATLAAISATRYLEQGNMYEVLKIQTIFLCTIKCYLGKMGVAAKTAKRLIDALSADLLERLEDFSLWLAREYSTKPLFARSPFAEFGLYHSRKIMMMAIVAIYMLFRRNADANYSPDELIHEFIRKPINFPFLQSEGLMPAFLSVFWAKSIFLATRKSDHELMNVIRTIMIAQSNKDRTKQLPSPHYELDEVIRWRFKEFLGRMWHELDRDSSYNRSWFLLPLLFMLVRRNFKQTVRCFWPDVTKIMHVYTELRDPRDISMAKSEKAAEKSFYVKIPACWEDLIALAQKPSPALPPELADDPILVLLLCLYLPHRMTPNIVGWLDRKLCPKCWY